jgi:glycosyltransferase A (GT-A) superfamily protein (DUF2064 family)
MSAGTVIVVAKEPVAGRVKTRLCPPLHPGDAADLAGAALADTFAAVAATPCDRRVLALDGRAGPWVPPAFEVVAQPQRPGLDERLAAALAGARGPTLLIGMDTPQVTSELLAGALARLVAGADAVLGPAPDGGYWLLGLATPDPAAVLGVPMSTATTGAAQRARLDALGLTTVRWPSLRDVDEFDDAVAVARAAPNTDFASEFARVTGRVPEPAGGSTRR